MDNTKLAIDNQSIKLPDFAFGKEWALLELLTLGLYSSVEQEMFAQLISSQELNWSELLEQATRHKILALLAFYALSEQFVEIIPRDVKYHLRTMLFLNRHKIAIYRREAARIIQIFNQNNIRFVGTKGISFESTLYDGNGSRMLSDIDFMILPQEREIVRKILSDLGYVMGSFEQKTGKIKPHSRELMIRYKLNPDHLPSHVLLTGDPMVRFIDIDVANSLTWTLCPFKVPVEVALENIIYQSIPGIKDVQLPCFYPQFQFIFTILHLFKEAWIEITVNMNGKDVSLSKFGDVVRLWRVHQNLIQSEDFVRLIEKYQITEPLLWVLEHLDRSLNTNIVSALGLESRITEEWLSSAGSSNGKVRQWQGTMRKRLFCKDRRQLFIR